MIKDMKSTEDITTSLSSVDTCKADSTIYCELSCYFKKLPSYGKPHRMLTNSDAIIENVYDDHDENDVTARSQSVMKKIVTTGAEKEDVLGWMCLFC